VEKQKRLLIVDGLNIYMRSYIANPSISTNGDPIGGCKGFLMSLQKIVRNVNPDRIVVVWDGNGGSARKRKLCPGYKGGRKPVRLNRAVRDLLTEAQEQANKAWQYTNTIDYLDLMPVTQICINGFEADDIISYVNSMSCFHGYTRIIVSTDKDFYQCVSNDAIAGQTAIYRPKQLTKKSKEAAKEAGLPPRDYEVITEKNLIETTGIHPSNFVIARTMEGDKSDNLPGIPGVGLKTVAKKFPFLREDNEYYLQDIYEECEKNLGKAKIYDTILENKSITDLNYQMMQLSAPNLSAQAGRQIQSRIKSPLVFNKTAIAASMIADGFGTGNWDELFAICRRFMSAQKNATTNTKRTTNTCKKI